MYTCDCPVIQFEQAREKIQRLERENLEVELEVRRVINLDSALFSDDESYEYEDYDADIT